jgi:NTE family protein
MRRVRLDLAPQVADVHVDHALVPFEVVAPQAVVDLRARVHAAGVLGEDRQEVVFAAGPLEPALLASTALPGLFPPIRHDGRILVDGAVVNTVPLSHALAGPVDRVYVLNIANELHRSLRSPIDVAIRAFAISRKQRFELELRSVPESVEVVVMPGPPDNREVTDFSGPDRLIEQSYRLAEQTLDDAELARRKRLTLRRPWWRRYAG